MKLYGYVLIICLSIFFNIFPKSLKAETLSEVVQLSLLNSNTFKAAVETYNQNYMYKKMATGYLLPTVSLDGNYTIYNPRKTQSDASNTKAVNTKTTGYSISLKIAQPLFNYQAIQQYRKATIVGDIARTQLEIDRNDIIIKTVQAYLNVLSDQEKIKYLKIHEGYVKDLKKASEAKLKVGKSIAVEVEQINAQIAELNYTLSLAQNTLIADMRALDSLVGFHVNSYIPLSDAFINIDIANTSFEDWKNQVTEANLTLILATLNLESSNYDTETLKSGYYPSVSLYASHGYTKNNIDNDKAKSALITDSSIGISLSMNLFKGGLDEKQVIQSRHKHNAMLFQLEQLKTDLITKTTMYYNNIYNGMNQIKSLMSSAKSNKLYLDMTMEAYSVGLKTNSDTLNAAQTYADVLNKLSEAKYNLILSVLSLKAIAGYVSLEDVQEFDKYF